MATKALALTLSHNIKPFTNRFIMTAQNQSSGGLLKNKFNLGQNTKALFQVLA